MIVLRTLPCGRIVVRSRLDDGPREIVLTQEEVKFLLTNR